MLLCQNADEIDYGQAPYKWVSNRQHPALAAEWPWTEFATWHESRHAIMAEMRADYEDMLKQHPSLREHTDFEWQQAMTIISATGENQPFVVYFNGWFWWSTPTL